MFQLEDIPKLFYKNLAGMIVAAMMAMLGIVVDGIIISRYLGTSRMAAYGLAAPVTNLIMVFSGIFSSGSQVVCAQHIGEGNLAGARRTFSVCMAATLLLSAVLMAFLFFFHDEFCILLGAKGNSAVLLPLASEYLLGLLFSIPSVLLLFEFNGLMRLDNDPNRIIAAVVVMTLLDVVGDLLNVFVVHADMFGMGISTSISYAAALVIMLLHFRRKDTIFRFTFRDMRLSDLKDILVTGSSSAVGAGSAMLRNRVLNGIMLGTVSGVAATAALSVMNTILNITSCAMVGLGMTCSMFAGFISGKGDEEMAETLVRITAKTALIFAGVLFLILFPFAPYVIRVFEGVDSREMTAIASRGLRFYASGIFLYALNTSFINYTQGIRRIAISNVFCFLNNFVFIVIPAFALAGILDSDAVWIAFIVTEVLTFLSIVGFTGWTRGHVPSRLSDYTFLKIPEEP